MALILRIAIPIASNTRGKCVFWIMQASQKTVWIVKAWKRAYYCHKSAFQTHWVKAHGDNRSTTGCERVNVERQLHLTYFDRRAVIFWAEHFIKCRTSHILHYIFYFAP